ncbi:MAG: hypothetical protein HKN84_11590 [Gammaproteobacteria bacterium]|nr:hypothetical protein [Gammaproteobacteria bacterium]
MTASHDTGRTPVSLWRWLLAIVGVNVLLVLLGFFIPASDEQVYAAAVQHLLRSEGLIGQSRRPTVAYIRTEEPLSLEVRESLTAYASSSNVYLRWLNDVASMALEAERSIENGGYMFSLGAPNQGVILSGLDAETHVMSGGGSSELVFYHWMGVCEVWRERELPRIQSGDP